MTKLSEDLRDLELIERVLRRLGASRCVDHGDRTNAKCEKGMRDTLRQVDQWASKMRWHQIKATIFGLFAIIAAFIGLAVWMVLKTSAGAGL